MKIGNSILYCILLCGCLFLQTSHALSLGNVAIESFLNQPLNFSIPVRKSSSEHWQATDLLVSLADADTYHQQDLAYPWALGEVFLDVQGGADGQLLIRGRSQKVVRELVVALLIRVEWPKGSIQKEYTALIDVNGVTNIAPKPVALELAEPEPIQVTVKNSMADQSVLVQPFSGEASAVEPAGEDVERLVVVEQPSVPLEVAPVVTATQQPVVAELSSAPVEKPAREAYPSQEPVYLYKVARGDVLSLLAQRFRGDVELPLHRYIHSINDENIDQYPQGMAELSIGQLIRIPNPEHVATAYTYSKRELLNADENVSHHRYRVRYGDSLFLIAQAFKPEGVDTETFMQTLIAENPEVLSADQPSLRPRLQLRIPNGSYIEAAPAPELPMEVPLEVPEVVVEMPPEVKVMEPPAIEQIPPAVEIEQPIADAVLTDEFLLADNGLGIQERRSLNPRLKANLRAIEQYVGNDEKNLVYEVIQTNNRLPLLYEQVIRLNQQISSLQLDMAELQVNNKQLQQQLDTAQQQQLDSGASRRLQWFLLVLVLLLLTACMAMYLYIRKLAKGLDFKLSPLATVEPQEQLEQTPEHIETVERAAPRTHAPKLKELFASRAKKQEQKPVVVGEQDYSQYDISKSNYDYSQAYDVGALEEKMKSGANAFERATETIEFETYTENLVTVKRLTQSGDFVAAELLLDKLLAADSSQFDNWLARLELQLKTNKQQEADALYIQLQQMFVEPEQLAALENVKFPAQPMPQEECVAVSLPQVSQYPEPDADKLYEVRVYLSYSHLDMAELSINSLLAVNPLFPETLLLKLEWLAASGLQTEFLQLKNELERRRCELSEAEASALDKLLGEVEFDPEEDAAATAFDDSTQILSQFDTEDASAEMTAIIDEGFDLDELEELDDDPVIEAESDDEKEFLAAIQEQMESYSSEEEAKKLEDTPKDSDKAVIPDDVRIFD